MDLSLSALLVLIGITYILFRVLRPNPANINTSASSQQRDRALLQATEQLSTMFPQVDQRTLAWDLRRNGGSVSATAEKVLSGSVLEAPPASFSLPVSPTPPPPAPSTSPSSTTPQPNLIARYNLTTKIDDKGKGKAVLEDDETAGQAKAKSAWASSKEERAALLSQRREEMILKARRQILERDELGGT